MYIQSGGGIDLNNFDEFAAPSYYSRLIQLSAPCLSSKTWEIGSVEAISPDLGPAKIDFATISVLATVRAVTRCEQRDKSSVTAG